MKFVGLFLVLLSFRSSAFAQQRTARTCPPKPGAAAACTQVSSWAGLKGAVGAASAELILCPFDLQKDEAPPLNIRSGITITCRKAHKDDACRIRGDGTYMSIASDQPSVIQGLTFEDSKYHAIVVRGWSDEVTHSFCGCDFKRNKRIDSIRGGALKTEKGSGIVHVESCVFDDNSSSHGGAIYSRSKMMMIVDSYFLENKAASHGGAIYTSAYASLSIEASTFYTNEDRDGHPIIVKPSDGEGTWIDEGDNLSSGSQGCNGFFDFDSSSCSEFPKTRTLSSDAPSSSPVPTRFIAPTDSASPSLTPSSSMYPSLEPSQSFSASPSRSQTPSEASFGGPSQLPSPQPSPSPSEHPSFSFMPSLSLKPSESPSSVTTTLCGEANPKEMTAMACTNVTSWEEFIGIVENASGTLTLCPFQITKSVTTSAKIAKDLVLVCPSSNSHWEASCSIEGPGTHLTVAGDTRVTISGFSFDGSNETAVQVQTSSRQAETFICWCRFMLNVRNNGEGGGLSASESSGVVSVIYSSFWYGGAIRGGAISGRSYKLTVIGTSFVGNNADETASAIYSHWNSHLLLRECLFIRNVASVSNVDVVFNTSSCTGINGVFVDAGGNQNLNSGSCVGVLYPSTSICENFDNAAGLSTPVYPYIPGDLSVYDEKTGVALSTGLTIREIARSGEYVKMISPQSPGETSSTRFHDAPDGAAIVSTDDDGWMYVSNCESKTGNGAGGVFGVKFDPNGEILDYAPLLQGTTRNCNGGLTPWNTWISCEEFASGQCWQVDPLGMRDPEPTVLGEPAGGNFEAFAYDDRNPQQWKFFITEDHMRGALRRFRPDDVDQDNFWDCLHGTGIRDYLKINPETGTFEWISSIEEGRRSAEMYFPQSEGISHRNGVLYFVSKKLRVLYILNIDTMEYTTSNVNGENLLGRGHFREEADHVFQLTDKVVYLTEDGGRTPGVYGKDTSTGQYFAIMEAQDDRYKHDEATGIAFSPDWTRMYVCLQEIGILFEIRRRDGLPFEHNSETEIHLKFHNDAGS